MTKVGIVLSLFFIHTALAADPTGCLSPAGAKKMLIDKNCECLKTNSCIKFKARKFSSSYYDSTDKSGNLVFSNVEKVKLKESYDIFYKIMEMKASGLSKSDEIKDLYIKLDKLNYDVRTSLLKNHAADYVEIRAGYKKGQEDRNKRKKKQNEKILAMLSKDKKSIVRPSAEPIAVVIEKEKEKEAPIPHTNVEIASAKVSALPFDRAVTESNEEKSQMLKSIKPEKLNREENDSLFDIITKSYMRSAYPKLLSP